MTSNNNFKDVAKQILAQAQKIKQATIAEQKAWGQDTKSILKELSSGELGQDFLETQSPGLYSLARAANPAFDAVINRQTGDLLNGWRVSTTISGNEITTTISNTSDHYKYLESDPDYARQKMRNRPIVAKAIYENPPTPRIEKAISEA